MRDLHPSAAHGEVGGGEAVIHLHAIVDALALLGRDFTPTQVERKRARKTKADRFFCLTRCRTRPRSSIHQAVSSALMRTK
jgi:hypothetical protein